MKGAEVDRAYLEYLGDHDIRLGERMKELPDTNNRMNDLPNHISDLWNETGYRCYCGNVMIVGSKKRLFCGGCCRYWERAELERVNR